MQSLLLLSPGDWFVAWCMPHEKNALSTCRNSGSVPGSHDSSHSPWLPFLLCGLSAPVNTKRAKPAAFWLASSWLAVCWTVNLLDWLCVSLCLFYSLYTCLCMCRYGLHLFWKIFCGEIRWFLAINRPTPWKTFLHVGKAQ